MLQKLILVVLLLLPAVLQIAGPGNTPRDRVDVATICWGQNACGLWTIRCYAVVDVILYLVLL